MSSYFYSNSDVFSDNSPLDSNLSSTLSMSPVEHNDFLFNESMQDNDGFKSVFETSEFEHSTKERKRLGKQNSLIKAKSG